MRRFNYASFIAIRRRIFAVVTASFGLSPLFVGDVTDFHQEADEAEAMLV